jgi:hypothetical protein
VIVWDSDLTAPTWREVLVTVAAYALMLAPFLFHELLNWVTR